MAKKSKRLLRPKKDRDFLRSFYKKANAKTRTEKKKALLRNLGNDLILPHDFNETQKFRAMEDTLLAFECVI